MCNTIHKEHKDSSLKIDQLRRDHEVRKRVAVEQP